MGLKDIYDVDQELAEDGVWVDLGDGVEIKVRRTRSAIARKVRERLFAPYAKLRRMGREVKPDIEEKLNRAWVAEGLLIDWRGIIRDDVGLEPNGAPDVAYSAEMALRAFDANPEFLDDVVFFAAERETFRRKEMEAAADELTTFPKMEDGMGAAPGGPKGKVGQRKGDTAR